MADSVDIARLTFGECLDLSQRILERLADFRFNPGLEDKLDNSCPTSEELRIWSKLVGINVRREILMFLRKNSPTDYNHLRQSWPSGSVTAGLKQLEHYGLVCKERVSRRYTLYRLGTNERALAWVFKQFDQTAAADLTSLMLEPSEKPQE